MIMSFDVTTLPKFEFYSIMVCWFVFALGFLLRKRPPRRARQKRDVTSLVGFGVMGVGFSLVWFFRRPEFTPLLPSFALLEIVPAFIVPVLGFGSVWFALAAIRALGSQWNPVAQLVEEHRLVTSGPYARVRHPIYAALIGLMAATGLAVSAWPVLFLALPLGWYGALSRIRSEEVLLRGAFGDAFLDYARRVPALIPRLSSADRIAPTGT
jgi:protein-S-isoprenylcysteine O-methyltransferase Ste14